MVNEKYEFHEVIGHGASAVVHRAVERASGAAVAIKDIKFDHRMNDHITMGGEAASLLALSDQHRGVVGLIELFATANRLFLVTRLAEGDLLSLLAETLPKRHPSGYYTEADVARVFKQLLLAVQGVHERGIVHRDLKFDNLLYLPDPSHEDGFELMVADFGLSAPPGHVSPLKKNPLLKKLLLKGGSNKNKTLRHTKRSRRLMEVWGTVEYLSPEVRATKPRGYGAQADSWALGCLLVEMLTGELAFPYAEAVPTLGQRLGLFPSGLRRFETLRGWREQPLSLMARELAHGLLYPDPVKRLSVGEALSHPFFHQLGSKDSSKPLVVACESLKGRLSRRKLRRQKEKEKEFQEQQLRTKQR